MEVMPQIHMFLQVSLRCCLWNPIESWKREAIQTRCFPFAFPTAYDPWVIISREQKLNQPSGCSNLSCDSESQTRNRLLDLRFLCLCHSWASRECYLPNQLFLGTSFGSRRAFEFLPNPPQGPSGANACLILRNTSVSKWQGAGKQCFLLQIKKYTFSQNHPKATV